MASPLASLFSTIDSAKRILRDRLSDPVADIKKTVARGKEDLQKFDEVQRAGGAAATEAMLNAVLNTMPGGGLGGIILPAGAVNMGKAKVAGKLIDSGKAKEAWQQYKVYRDPIDQILKTVVPDTGFNLKAVGSARESGYFSDAFQGPWPKFEVDAATGSVPARQVMQHPGLDKYAPGILDKMEVMRSWDYDSGSMARAGDLMRLGPHKGAKGLQSTALHELQHAIQSHFDMATGGNSSSMIKNHNSVAGVEQALRDLPRGHANAFTPGIMTGLSDLKQVAAMPGREAFKRYEQIPGEVEARTVQKMFENNNYRVNPAALQLHEYRKLGTAAPYQWADDLPEYKALESALRDLGLISTKP
jgi:hypothetical protein